MTLECEWGMAVVETSKIQACRARADGGGGGVENSGAS